jgi:hypothetical protein
MRVELFGGSGYGRDSVRSKVSVVLSETTPGDQVPPVAIVGQSQGFNFATQCVGGSRTAISDPQHGPICQSLLNEKKSGWTISPGLVWYRHPPLQTRNVVLVIRRQNGSDFCQRRVHGRRQGAVGEAVHQHARGYQCGCFLGCEVHRREVITLYDAVTQACFADHWHARFRERSNVSIDSADARLEFISDILRPGNPAPLQMNKDGDKSIDAVHGS